MTEKLNLKASFDSIIGTLDKAKAKMTKATQLVTRINGLVSMTSGEVQVQRASLTIVAKRKTGYTTEKTFTLSPEMAIEILGEILAKDKIIMREHYEEVQKILKEIVDE